MDAKTCPYQRSRYSRWRRASNARRRTSSSSGYESVSFAGSTSESFSCLADVERRAVSKLAGENECSRGLESRCVAHFVYHALRLTVYRSNWRIPLAKGGKRGIYQLWRVTSDIFLRLLQFLTRCHNLPRTFHSHSGC